MEEGNKNLEYLRDKYPDVQPSVLRKYMLYMNACLPESFWENEIKIEGKNKESEKSILYSIDAELIKHNNGMAFFNDIDIEYQTIAYIVKRLIKHNTSCYWMNYYMLIGNLIGKFGEIEMNKVFDFLNGFKYIFITNIRGGKIYEKNEEHFTLLMENFLYPLKQTNFVLCFDYIKKEQRQEVYGSLYSLMSNSTQVTEIG